VNLIYNCTRYTSLCVGIYRTKSANCAFILTSLFPLQNYTRTPIQKYRILSSQLLQISYQITWKPSDCSDWYIYQCFLQHSASATQVLTKLLSWQRQLLCSTFLPATGPNFPLL